MDDRHVLAALDLPNNLNSKSAISLPFRAMSRRRSKERFYVYSIYAIYVHINKHKNERV